MKVAIIVLLSVLIVLVAFFGVYYLLSDSSTVPASAPNPTETIDTIEEPQEPTPEPTVDHTTEFMELESIYSQKEKMIEHYYTKVDQVLKTYGENEKFGEFYALAITSFEDAQRMSKNIRSSDENYPEEFFSAANCAIYFTFAQDMEIKLSEIRVAIDKLKVEFNTFEYIKTKELLATINDNIIQFK